MGIDACDGQSLRIPCSVEVNSYCDVCRLQFVSI